MIEFYKYKKHPQNEIEKKMPKYAIGMRDSYSQGHIGVTKYDILIDNMYKTKDSLADKGQDYDKIVELLNYLYCRYNILSENEISFEHVQEFLCEKFLKPMKNETRDKWLAAITLFSIALKENGFGKWDDHYLDSRIMREFTYRKSRSHIHWSEYKVITKNNSLGNEKLDQNPPMIVGQFLLLESPPMIRFAIAICLYCGLRSGEVCNLRQDKSGSYTGRYQKGFVVNEVDRTFSFNLKYDLNLNPRAKTTSDIKRNRLAISSPMYYEILHEYYLEHKELIKNMSCDDVLPLFLNNNCSRQTGKHNAMSVASFRRLFKRAFQNALKRCEWYATKYNDAELLQYVYSMRNHTIGPHALRHLFTVNLVMAGLPAERIMELRGDKDIKTSLIYVNNRHLYQKEYEKMSMLLHQSLQSWEEYCNTEDTEDSNNEDISYEDNGDEISGNTLLAIEDDEDNVI